MSEKHLWLAAALILAVPAWADDTSTRDKHTEAFRRNQERLQQQENRYRNAARNNASIAAAEEERLARLCQQEQARDPKVQEGSACWQLGESRYKRGWIRHEWSASVDRTCYYDGRGNLLSC